MASSTLENLTDAGALDGTESVYVVQGGNDRKTDVDGIVALARGIRPISAQAAGAIADGSTDQRSTLRSALDTYKALLLSSVANSYAVASPLRIKNDEVFDGLGGTLYNAVSGGSDLTHAALTTGMAHPITIHGDWTTASQVGGLTWHATASASGNTVTADTGLGSNFSVGCGVLVRGSTYRAYGSDQRWHPQLLAARCIGLSGDVLTLDVPIPKAWEALTLEIANTDEGVTADLSETFQIGFNQIVQNTLLRSDNGNGHDRGGMIDGMLLNVHQRARNAFANNLIQRTPIIGGTGLGWQKAGEFANNCRDVPVVGRYFGLYDAGSFGDGFAFAINEHCSGIHFIGCTIDADEYDVATDTPPGYLIGSGTKATTWTGGRMAFAQVTGALVEVRGVTSDVTETENHAIIGALIEGGDHDRAIYINQQSGATVRHFRSFATHYTATPDLYAIDMAGTLNSSVFDDFDGGGATLQASADKCRIVGGYLPDGLVDTTAAERAANVVALNFSDTSIANNILCQAADSGQNTVTAGTYTSVSPEVIAQVDFPAGSIPDKSWISVKTYGQAGAVATENRTAKVQFSKDGGSSWGDVATVVCTADTHDFLIDAELYVDSNTTIEYSARQSGPTGTTPNVGKTTTADIAVNGLKIRVIGYTAASTGTLVFYRSRIRIHSPGMHDFDD